MQKFEDLEIEIPEELQKMLDVKLPNTDEFNYWKEKKERIYRLRDIIDDRDEELIDMIRECNVNDVGKPIEERKPIKILINSDGGDIVIGWGIIKAIEASKTPVWTICYGRAYSMAAEILVAGHKRYSMPGSQCMFHRGSTSISGETSVVESTQAHFKKLEKRMEEYLLSHTKINPIKYKKKVSADIYMFPEDMIDNGVIDEIITDYDLFA